MTDFRALCVELTDCLEKADWPPRYQSVFQQWINIAHAALAEADGPAVSDDREPASVTTQPSDAELDELAWTWYSKTGSTWYQIEAFRAYARAALARWGGPAAAPVPVSERWPEFSGCDPQERVWVWNPVLDHWKLSRVNQSVHTHWLPANALPLPAPEPEDSQP